MLLDVDVDGGDIGNAIDCRRLGPSSFNMCVLALRPLVLFLSRTGLHKKCPHKTHAYCVEHDVHMDISHSRFPPPPQSGLPYSDDLIAFGEKIPLLQPIPSRSSQSEKEFCMSQFDSFIREPANWLMMAF